MVYDRWRIIADFSLLHLVASFAHLVDVSTENSATSLCESWDAGRDRLEENSPRPRKCQYSYRFQVEGYNNNEALLGGRGRFRGA